MEAMMICGATNLLRGYCKAIRSLCETYDCDYIDCYPQILCAAVEFDLVKEFPSRRGRDNLEYVTYLAHKFIDPLPVDEAKRFIEYMLTPPCNIGEDRAYYRGICIYGHFIAKVLGNEKAEKKNLSIKTDTGRDFASCRGLIITARFREAPNLDVVDLLLDKYHYTSTEIFVWSGMHEYALRSARRNVDKDRAKTLDIAISMGVPHRFPTGCWFDMQDKTLWDPDNLMSFFRKDINAPTR